VLCSPSKSCFTFLLLEVDADFALLTCLDFAVVFIVRVCWRGYDTNPILIYPTDGMIRV
jgi:hypothetical protein